ncbi:MAG TPA: MgtC/SapB family protein [Thermoanaerobaculia bacterium]|nr:MgtC/SapB family protein [Thermoanaerobaculia bacterium]
MTLRDLLTDPAYGEMALRLSTSLLIGALIGLERTYHSRPAGFRTHALVCLSTALLMLLTAFGTHWFTGMEGGRVNLDPTRMAQGIMTGIGFLGAGAIIKDGMSVRGLTTAASLWITASIGILIGAGLFFPAILATAFTLGLLALFKRVENRIPVHFVADFFVRFALDGALLEAELRRMMREHGVNAGACSQRLDRDAGFVEYRMSIQSRRDENVRSFARALGQHPAVRETGYTPAGD